MAEPERDKLTLEIDSGTSPLAGVLHDAHGVTHPFSGWVGLAAALEHALTKLDPADETRFSPQARSATEER
jgi:hypothetical protein